ncbi:MAG: nucleotidyltransferase [Chloroflexi bacterium]|nr:nucleotidyltransferase [Chloroflexota bacterium]
MATINKSEIIEALERLGQLAEVQGERVELLLVGGAVMVLAYDARRSTRDVDAVILAPPEARIVRSLAKTVATERDWPDDWLNDAAKGYLVGLTAGPVVFSAPGIEARRPAIEQLLAMKLSAWRDDVDIADARRLLDELPPGGAREEVWKAIEPHLVSGDELKAQYAFWDLWESLHGDD